MKFDFGVAEPADDPAIRRLLAENPMPGLVTVAFQREPDYFIGHGVMGDRCVTLKAMERETGRLAGVMCLAASERYVAGKVRPVGYIGQIRIDRRFQGTMLPLRSFPFIREQVRHGWPDLWFGAIVDDNPAARALFLERRRPSFPIPHPVSDIHTLALLTRRRYAGGAGVAQELRAPARAPVHAPAHALGSGSVILKRGSDTGWPPIVDFFRRYESLREFFPRHEISHFAKDQRTPGLGLQDFLVAERDGEIAGVCAVWDQSAFKQTVVHGYRGWLDRARPLINAAGPVAGWKKLPRVGQPIASAYLSHLAVRDDDPAVFRGLLTVALGDAYTRGKDYLMAGFAVGDPLLRLARRFRHILYRSTMVTFRFDGGAPADSYNPGKIPYLEVATL